MTNRTIKFRAWDRALKGWIVEWVNFAEGRAYVLRNRMMVELMDADVVQFTGLLDSKGREIYEGDFLKSKNTVIRVQWSRKAYNSVGFGAIGLDGDTEYNIHHFCAHGEIIGNIYQNPELLKHD